VKLLEVKGLRKQFGGLVAIEDLSFHIEKGEILGMIGPNGAGKSTAFNLITGFYSPTAGEVEFKGEGITGLKPSQIAGRGIVRTWQEAGLFANMSVLQCVIIGCHLRGRIDFWRAILGGTSVREKEGEVRKKANKILDLMGLTDFKDMLSKHLPHGFLRRLGIAIALGADPELMLLDEPVSGMNPEEIRGAMALIKGINKEGMTVLLVEHNMRAVMSTCDRIVVLHHGRKIAEGLPQEIARDQKVIQAYLGGAAKVA
jgi:branched-chain amino acid transport system ATP-binding protein